MAGIGTGYDLSVTTFSPDGRVFQTEYAQKAVDNAGTAAGIRCKDGVVLAVEKLVLSKMLVPGSNRRIHAVDRHAGIATTGLAPDGRQIVNRAQSEAANYKQLNGSKIPGHVLNERLAAFNHIFSLYWCCHCWLSCWTRAQPRLQVHPPPNAFQNGPLLSPQWRPAPDAAPLPGFPGLALAFVFDRVFLLPPPLASHLRAQPNHGGSLIPCRKP
mmetsp:Transcript_17645/g.42320  ORF Transcript_17645/g.42320 Transcript_17645/m.42320 type:complete len:214 (+) Transcript_17645:173-814(+)